jgi:hypothetical protein
MTLSSHDPETADMPDSNVRPVLPPRQTNFDGAARHVGVEVEFAAVSSRDAAEAIAGRFGGQIIKRDRHRYEISDTALGTFKCELDSRYAHPDAYPRSTDEATDRWLAGLREMVSAAFGDIGGLIIPNEIVTPPIPVDRISDIDLVTADLVAAGAQGTEESVFFAFGLHLNPDIATRDPAWILNVIRAELLLSRWLRGIMEIDTSRQLTGFASPFPGEYATHILKEGYEPDQDRLIDDYLTFNPTRDRELDMLPLFTWLDRDRVRRRLPDVKIGTRPTFHYRLPNASLSQSHWSITREWNRWCVIEARAERPDIMQPMAREFLDLAGRDVFDHWSVRSSDWIVQLYQTADA